MTELARYTPAATPGPVVYATDPTGGRLIAWADGLAAAHRIGSALCSTSFVPAAFRGKPEEAAAAILYGDEIGLTPTQALQSVHVISGRPGLYARAMVALLLAHGHDLREAKGARGGARTNLEPAFLPDQRLQKAAPQHKRQARAAYAW